MTDIQRRKKLIDRMSIRISTITKELWHKAVFETVHRCSDDIIPCGTHISPIVDHIKTSFLLGDYQLDGVRISRGDMKRIHTDASSLYLKNMLKLSTHDLNAIIWLHKNSGPTRAPKTIQELLTELSERSFFNALDQSDTNDNDGDK